MIYCTNEIRAKVWHVGTYNGRLMISITTSERKQNGDYTSSSWFCRCLSESKKTLKEVKKGDNITIKRCALRNTYNKEKNKEYFGFDIYEAEITNKATDGSEQSEADEADDDATDDDLPF